MTPGEFMAEYVRLAHAIQSAVAFGIAGDPDEAGATPKHLRVGLDLLCADSRSLLMLLAEKGIASDAEVAEALRVALDVKMAEVGALGRLLVEKGVSTEEELQRAFLDGLTLELSRLTMAARRRTGLAQLEFE